MSSTEVGYVKIKSQNPKWHRS